MTDLLLPRTDGGVVVQVVLLTILAAGALLATRRHAEVRILVVGLTLFAYGAIGLRALH